MRSMIVAALLATALSATAAERPTIAVAEFTNDTAASWWRGDVGWELSGMLSNELSNTGAFRVVERSQLKTVLEEQNLGASGRAEVSNVAQMGKLAGAQYLVTGTVTAFEEEGQNAARGFSFKGISIGGKANSAYLAVDLRVIDTTSGIVEYSRTIEGSSKGGGVSLDVWRSGYGGSLDSYKNTPTGKAIRAAVIMSGMYLECVMVKQDGCEAKFRAQDEKRRQKTLEALDID